MQCFAAEIVWLDIKEWFLECANPTLRLLLTTEGKFTHHKSQSITVDIQIDCIPSNLAAEG